MNYAVAYYGEADFKKIQMEIGVWGPVASSLNILIQRRSFLFFFPEYRYQADVSQNFLLCSECILKLYFDFLGNIGGK